MKIKNSKIVATYMRLASIVGILLILVLQFLWFTNSYKMIDKEIMEKCKDCLREAIDNEMFERFDKISGRTFLYKKKGFNYDGYEIIASGYAERTEDLKFGLNESLYKLGSQISLNRVIKLFDKLIKFQLDYTPKFQLSIENDTIPTGISSIIEKNFPLKTNNIHKLISKKNTSIQYDVINNHEIRLRLNSKQVVKMEVSPSSNIFFKKADFLIKTSIIIVLLIGFILISQLRTVLREQRFVQFIKEYTNAITHDLQTPMNNIMLALDILNFGKFDDDITTRKKYYKICKEQSERQIRNVRKILFLANEEQTNIILEKQKVILKDFLEGIADYFKKGVLSKNDKTTLNIHCFPENLTVEIDADKMENTINNLIDNSIKFSTGSVNIDIECYDNEEYVFIKIKDNGMGISAQDIDNIFKNFKRGSEAERKHIYGYGIGLSFVKKVVEMHGGEVKVTSIKDVGSEFIMSFPK
jgi:two-component system, OmpR family, phosphate regulon sensor histidine kinase PhoR